MRNPPPEVAEGFPPQSLPFFTSFLLKAEVLLQYADSLVLTVGVAWILPFVDPCDSMKPAPTSVCMYCIV